MVLQNLILFPPAKKVKREKVPNYMSFVQKSLIDGEERRKEIKLDK